jgi:hypothetical protein
MGGVLATYFALPKGNKMAFCNISAAYSLTEAIEIA